MISKDATNLSAYKKYNSLLVEVKNTTKILNSASPVFCPRDRKIIF